MAEREVDLTLRATDEASDKIGEVADALEGLDDAEVEVSADTDSAAREVRSFEDQVEGLTDDARELRITFRAEQLRRQIGGILRQLEQVDDPTEIDILSSDLERTQQELRDLADLADDRYDIEINADPGRTAARAAGDIDDIRRRGEGLQSALPAIRGFGDELGGVSQGAGIASQAVADLGDFALISGERFATEGSRMAGVATRLGTVLGAAGLAGAIGGIAVQLGTTLIPKISEWISGSEDALEVNEDLAESVRGVSAALAEGDYRQAVDEIVNANSELIEQGEAVGVSAQRTVDFLLGLADPLDLAADKTGEGSQAFQQFALDAKFAREEIDTGIGTIERNNQVIADTAARLVEGDSAGKSYSERLVDIADQYGIATDGADDMTEAEGDLNSELATGAELLEQAVTAIEEVNTARRAAADATFAVRDAEADLAEQLEASTEAIGAEGASLADLRSEADDVAQAAGKVADEQVRLARETAAAEGTTLSQTAATDTWNSSMLSAAAAARGPLRQGIVEYIASVNGIPPEKVSDIIALIDQGKITQAENRLSNVSRTRSSSVQADAITGQAENDLNYTARPRSTTITASLVASNIRNGIYYPPGGGQIPLGLAPGEGLPDLSDPVAPLSRAGGTSGLYLSSGSLTGRSAPLVAAGDTYRVTVNLPRAAEGRDVVAALDRWTRRNGRRSRR